MIIHCNTSIFHNVYNHFALQFFCDNYVYYEWQHHIKIQRDSVCAKKYRVHFQLCWSPNSKFHWYLRLQQGMFFIGAKKLIISPSLLVQASPQQDLRSLEVVKKGTHKPNNLAVLQQVINNKKTPSSPFSIVNVSSWNFLRTQIRCYRGR